MWASLWASFDPTKLGAAVSVSVLVVGAIVGSGYKGVNQVNRAKAKALQELVDVRDEQIDDLQRQVDDGKARVVKLETKLKESDAACEEKLSSMDHRVRSLERLLADRQLGGST